MRRLWIVTGILLVVVGAVWTLQGAGVLKGSFMTGGRMWFWIGMTCVAAGVFLIGRTMRARPKG